MGLYEDTLSRIAPVDESRAEAIQRRLDSKTKPPGSLGRLEEMAKRVCLITGKDDPDVSKKAVFVFAGDHGVADEGVSAYPKVVTSQMVYNFLRGGAGVNVLARHVGADVVAADIGIPFLYRDFRLGWQEGQDASRKLGLYRQKYCGCVYSEKERYVKKQPVAETTLADTEE